MRRALLLLALCSLVATPAAAGQFRVVPLPWPPALLPKEPPLAPSTSGLPPVPIRFLGAISNRERVVVGIDARGAPQSVRVLQTITLGRLGDYVLAIPAPVVAVTPGPGTQSSPGERQNQILWEGFSPGRRVLSAWAGLRVSDSASSLPVELRLDSGDRRVTLTVKNVTSATVPSFTADPDPHTLAQVLDRIRDAIERDVFAEGLNIGVHGRTSPRPLHVAAPMRVEGTVRTRDRVTHFSGLLDGARRSELRVEIRGLGLNAKPPKIELRVTPAPVPDRLTPPGAPTWLRALRQGALGDRGRVLARAIKAELTYARKRQYDMFLASPEATGPSSTTYVYRTAAALRATPSAARSEGGGNTIGLIVLAIGLAVALPAGAVIWAHS